jgi:hypothetical protein
VCVCVSGFKNRAVIAVQDSYQMRWLEAKSQGFSKCEGRSGSASSVAAGEVQHRLASSQKGKGSACRVQTPGVA